MPPKRKAVSVYTTRNPKRWRRTAPIYKRKRAQSLWAKLRYNVRNRKTRLNQNLRKNIRDRADRRRRNFWRPYNPHGWYGYMSRRNK